MIKFLIVHFSIVIAAIILIRPEKFGFDPSQEALLEFQNYEIVKMSQLGQEVFLSAKTGQYFKDKIIIKNISIAYEENNILKTIKAEEALLKKDTIYFKGQIDYKDDKLRILTNNMKYNTKNKSVLISDTFRIENDQNYILGNYLNYQPKSDHLYIKSVHAKLQI